MASHVLMMRIYPGYSGVGYGDHRYFCNAMIQAAVLDLGYH